MTSLLIEIITFGVAIFSQKKQKKFIVVEQTIVMITKKNGAQEEEIKLTRWVWSTAYLDEVKKKENLGPFTISNHEFSTVQCDKADNIDLIPLAIDKNSCQCKTQFYHFQ